MTRAFPCDGMLLFRRPIDNSILCDRALTVGWGALEGLAAEHEAEDAEIEAGIVGHLQAHKAIRSSEPTSRRRSSHDESEHVGSAARPKPVI